MTPRSRGAALALAAALLVSSAPTSALAPLPARRPGAATPVLVERAVQLGELSRFAADRILLAALRGEAVPPEYRSRAPYDGTLVLLELQERLARLPAGEHRALLGQALHPGPLGTDQCGGIAPRSATPMPNTIESAHFYIEYNQLLLGGGLTIDDYVAALEQAWTKEVNEFGWAAPPPYPANPAPNDKYPVRIDVLGLALYGFVANGGTHAGFVGDNPSTPWNEGDASASCMVLNTNFDPFPGTPTQALQATVAHEFMHAIQFGWGVLDGGRFMPDGVFVEGGATWMEDEVFDTANDSYNYLWPVFDDDMGDYQGRPTSSPYDYWVTWRGLTEPHGTGVGGGGEDVFQRFWELTSRNQASNLEALDQALGQVRNISLGPAYHAYAIAVKFAKPCGGGYAPPYCLEEGPAYAAAARQGSLAPHATVGFGQAHQATLQDNYALHWIALPTGTRFQVALRNTSGGGRFRASVACDTGTGLVIVPFTDVAGAGETVFVRDYDPAVCASPVAVVTNLTQTDANPATSSARPYSLTVSPPPDRSTLTVRARASGARVVARGRLAPPDAGRRVRVTLLVRDGGWKPVKARRAKVRSAGGFRARFPQPDAARCRVEARFEGDADHLPSSARRSLRC